MDNGKMRNGKWKEKNGKRNKKKNGNKGMKIEKKKDFEYGRISSTPYNTLHTTLTRTAGALSTDLNDSWWVLG